MPRHPLVNPSLAPYGFVTRLRRERLEWKHPPNVLNAEKLIARMWDRVNRLNAPKPQPVRIIIHEIMPSLARAGHTTEEQADFVFDGLPYRSRDIFVLSNAIYWFGTNVGRVFLEDEIVSIGPNRIPQPHPECEFVVKLKTGWPFQDLLALWLHTCTDRCGGFLPFHVCYYGDEVITPRDRLVVDALMWWLGKKDGGRAFAAEFKAKKDRFWTMARVRREQAESQIPRRKVHYLSEM